MEFANAVKKETGTKRIEFDVFGDTVFIETDEPILAHSPEVNILGKLLPAMTQRQDISMKESIDGRFLKNIDQFQEIFHNWFSELQKVNIDAPVSEGTKSQAGHTGTFFTGGVDSFYTLKKNYEVVDYLIYVHGFDIRLENEKLYRQVRNAIHSIAKETGKGAVFIRTNLRECLDKYCDWGLHAHAVALACIAHTLKLVLKKVYIPASYDAQTLDSWGSHSRTDHLLGSSLLKVDHDGVKSRTEKIAELARWGTALKYLRVCWRNGNNRYNCCRCEKCVRTMTALYLENALHKTGTFEYVLDLTRVARLPAKGSLKRVFVNELIAQAVGKRNREVEKALRDSLDEIYYKAGIQPFFRRMTAFFQRKIMRQGILNGSGLN